VTLYVIKILSKGVHMQNICSSAAFIRGAVFVVVGPDQRAGRWILETKPLRSRKANVMRITLPYEEVIQGIADCHIELAAQEFSQERTYS
jgi:hypothetical protein